MSIPRHQRIYVAAGLWALLAFLNMTLLPGRYATRVEVEQVSPAPMPLIVRASGSLEAKDSNTVKAQFDGPVTSKLFREGQRVEKGQLLAVIDRERIRLDHQNKVNDLKNAKTELQRSRRDVKIQKELYRKEAVAYSTVEDAERALVKSQQALHTAEEAFRLAEIQWNSSQVTAPITGTVVKDWLGDDKTVANGKEIVTVADVSEYTVKAKVDELDIKQVHEGQPAEVRLQIYPGVVLPAVVKEVGSTPDGNGLPEVPIVLALSSTNGLALRPKLTAEGRINTGTTEPILSVPLTAVANADGDPRVWVLGPLQKIHPVPVTLGKTNPDRVEISQGLKAGQQVCVMAEPDYAVGMRVIVGHDGRPGSKTHALMKRIKSSNESNKKSPNAVFNPGARGPVRKRLP